MRISMEHWKAFRFKKESAFQGNDQYSQGVRDALAMVDEFLVRFGRGEFDFNVCDEGRHNAFLEFMLSENVRQFRGIPEDVAKRLKLEFKTEIVEHTPFKCSYKIRVIPRLSKAHED